MQKHFLLCTSTGPICEECDFLEGNETRILPWTYILLGLCKVCYPWIYLLSSIVVLSCLDPAGILVPSSDESLTTAVLKNSRTEISMMSNIWVWFSQFSLVFLHDKCSRVSFKTIYMLGLVFLLWITSLFYWKSWLVSGTLAVLL